MRWIRREWNKNVLPDDQDGPVGLLAYSLWISSYASRWLLATRFQSQGRSQYTDWQLIDSLINFGLSFFAAVVFAFGVPDPKDRPKFVLVIWFVTRLLWEQTHPVLP